MFFGVGAAIGAYFSGFLCDRFQLRNRGVVCCLLFLLGVLLTLLAITVAREKVLIYACGFIWGLGLYFTDSWILCICTKIYNGDLRSFASNKLFHSLSFCALQVMVIAGNGQIPVTGYLGLILALIICGGVGLLLEQRLVAPHSDSH